MILREITLIKEVETLDALNQPTTSETRTNLIAELRSTSRSEFFQGRQAGITPERVFILSAFDYSGEKIVEFEGERYAIYRTYEEDDDRIELYAQIEGGVTNAPTSEPDTNGGGN